VLSFPQDDGRHALLGDVVISVDTARRQAPSVERRSVVRPTAS